MKEITRQIAAIIAFTACLSALPSPLSPRAEGFFIRGDINGDGKANAADLVTLQKWLLAMPDAELASPEAADIFRDGCIDVFDLTALRKELLSYPHTAKISSPACKAASLGCIDSGELLYCDNISERIAPASLTKLLTASVALRYLSADTVITVGSEQSLVKSGSSLCLIQRGHRLKLYDLLTGMLMASGNDAAYTVAAATARAVRPDTYMSDKQAVEYFAELMNGFAAELGMESSHFVNPEGWDDDGQYTTVSDLMKLAAYAYSIPEIRNITGTYQKRVVFVSGENITWTNSNLLLDKSSSFYCADAAGMKTGTTPGAGNCLIAVFRRGGKTYLSAVTGCGTNNDRYELTKKLLEACGI